MAAKTRAKRSSARKKLSPEERKAKLDAAMEKLERGVAGITNTEGFKAYLKFLASFHNYSANNVMLIHSQNPEATMVAGFHDWRKKGRFVRKGEKGLMILAPLVGKVEDEKTGERESKVFGFRVTTVFDVSQTDGEEIPEGPRATLLASDTEGSKELYRRLLAIAESEGVRCFDQGGEEFHGRPGLRGFYRRSDKIIKLAYGLPVDQRTKTMCHELVHHLLHKDKEHGRRETAEIEAEGTAYAVLAHFGIEADDYSFAYIANWTPGGKLDPVKGAIATIRKTAHDLIERLEAEAEEEYVA